MLGTVSNAENSGRGKQMKLQEATLAGLYVLHDMKIMESMTQ